MALQNLRTSVADKRPIPTILSDGQIAVNTNEASPALFFKNSNGDLVKVGPVHIGTSAPNSSPASTAATALVTGATYQILTVGTSDFTTVGASANTVGTIFTATGTTTGTGTVSGQQGVEKGEMWLDTTGGTYVLKIYDGTAWRSESGTFVDAAGDTMTGALILPSGTASAPSLGVGSTDNGVYSSDTDEIAISTNGTARLIVDSGGNVSIGGTLPASPKFEVQNQGTIKQTLGTQTNALLIYNPTGTTIVGQLVIDAAGGSNLELKNSSGTTGINLQGGLGTGIFTGNITLNNSNLVFEGTTADANETTLTATDPTADRTIVLPDVSGNVVTTGDNGTVTNTMITGGTILNDSINPSAAIDLSKLATGALPSGITVASTNIVDGTIVNADINSSAAIGLSKLATGALPSGITIASANIVDGTIANADISSSAAIGLSKLATGALPSGITVASTNIVNGTIVDADINSSAAIGLSKLATGALPSGITVASANITDGTIVNADVNASAAIAGTKVSPDFGSQTILTSGEARAGYVAVNRNTTFGNSRLSVDGTIHAENGIFFSDDSANDQTLDAFEEGSFNPQLSGLSSSFYTMIDFRYVKIGRLVQWFGEINISNNSDGSSFVMTGLPFSPDNSSKQYVVPYAIDDESLSDNNLYFYQQGTNVYGKRSNTSSATYTQMDNNDIWMMGSYYSNS